jgi:hypothetical protein
VLAGLAWTYKLVSWEGGGANKFWWREVNTPYWNGFGAGRFVNILGIQNYSQDNAVMYGWVIRLG